MTARKDPAWEIAQRLNLVRVIPTSPRQRIAAALRRYGDKRAAEEREACAIEAENPRNIDPVGGSTGNAHGTAQRIAAAIRARGGKR